MKNAFDPKIQNRDLDSKIVAGLERISEAFRVMLWDLGKKEGLSPIQIQILIYLNTHANQKNSPAQIANEFNVTKATITDSLKALDAKNLIIKEKDPYDSRSYQVRLTSTGVATSVKISSFANPLLSAVAKISLPEKQSLMNGIFDVIEKLNGNQLKVQRMCTTCKYLSEGNKTSYHCTLLDQPLGKSELRIDCPEHELIEQ